MTDNTAGRRPRRSFSPEYKRGAARLVINTGRAIAEVGRELGVGAQALGRRVAAVRADQAGERTGQVLGSGVSTFR